MWLEETLKNYPSVLLMVSHSQDFLNGVCNSIIFMGKKQLTYYGGAAPPLCSLCVEAKPLTA